MLSHEVIVRLIANTATSKGLKIGAALDTKSDPVDTKVMKLKSHELQGDWNSTTLPSRWKNWAR